MVIRVHRKVEGVNRFRENLNPYHLPPSPPILLCHFVTSQWLNGLVTERLVLRFRYWIYTRERTWCYNTKSHYYLFEYLARRLEVVNNIKERIKSSWKPILWGLIPFIIIVIIFALPIKTVPVQVTEAYWETEMRNEPYTVPESYTETEAYTAFETRTETVYDAYVNSGNWSYSFNVNKPNSTVSVDFYGYGYSPSPYVIWVSGNHTRFLPMRYYWDSASKAVIKVSYPDEVTRYRTVTKYRDVVKYRQVPTQVLKERKVTKYVKMSIWAYLFFEQPR